MNIYLIDPLNSPIEVLFDNLNGLFAIRFNDPTELNVMLKDNNLDYFAGKLCFTHKNLCNKFKNNFLLYSRGIFSKNSWEKAYRNTIANKEKQCT